VNELFIDESSTTFIGIFYAASNGRMIVNNFEECGGTEETHDAPQLGAKI
jgi:hypothetical protein